MTGPDQLLDRLAFVRAAIDAAADRAGRDPGSVRMLLATKTVPVPVIAAAVRAGCGLIGENRAQELVAKAGPLTSALGRAPVRVHFIGRLQSNKIGQVLPLVDCVQSVASADLAQRLSQRALALGRVLDVLVQVNVSGEASKSGVDPAAALPLAAQVLTAPGLRLRGLMTIGLNSPDLGAVRAGYDVLAELGRRLRDGGAEQATELSMGMSGDYQVAVAAGATMVRIGSAVFGSRQVP